MMQTIAARREGAPPISETAALTAMRSGGIDLPGELGIYSDKRPGAQLNVDRRERFAACLAVALRLLARGDEPSVLSEMIEKIARSRLGPCERAFVAATLLAACEREHREAICDAGRGVTPFFSKAEIDAEADRQRRRRTRR